MTKQTTSLTPLYLTARHFGLKVKSLRKAAELGQIPAVRVGDDLLFDLDKVARAIESLAEIQPGAVNA